MTAVMSGVRVEKDLVFAGTWRADTVIGITVRPVEVEDEKSAGAIENDHFVTVTTKMGGGEEKRGVMN